MKTKIFNENRYIFSQKIFIDSTKPINYIVSIVSWDKVDFVCIEMIATATGKTFVSQVEITLGILPSRIEGKDKV